MWLLQCLVLLTDHLANVGEETRCFLREESVVAKSKTSINKSKFCRDFIKKVGIKTASVSGMREAWKAEGHSEKECPSSALYYQQTQKIRGKRSAAGAKAAKTRAANSKKTAVASKSSKTQPNLLKIEQQLEELTQAACDLKSPKLANALRQARRQAGAEILSCQ
mgnify:FL=1|jgi:hypothetical protein